jgi:hypothetical protein
MVANKREKQIVCCFVIYLNLFLDVCFCFNHKRGKINIICKSAL